MKADRISGMANGALCVFQVGCVSLVVASAFDAVPDLKYPFIDLAAASLAGALVGYAYAAVWSRWRS